jgi:hypothetical protein
MSANAGAVTKPPCIDGYFNAGATGIDPSLIDSFRMAGKFNLMEPANNNRSRTPFPPSTGRDHFGARVTNQFTSERN